MIGKLLYDGTTRMLNAAVTLLTPPRCRLCRAPLWGCKNDALCVPCLSGVEWIGSGACLFCGYPAGPHASHAHSCNRCRGRDLGLTGVVAVARYTGGAKHLIRSLKFSGERALAASISLLMAERWRHSSFFGKADLILPLPLHPKRLRQRGFDQAALLAEGIARELSLEYGENFAARTRFTVPQALLRREERLHSMEGAFAVFGNVTGRRVILVDDVLTTGTTMSACARACREAGAQRVYGLSFAR